MAFNPNLTDEYIRFLNWNLERIEGKHDQEEFKFNHNFIRRLDAVTNKIAKKRGFTYHKDYDFDIAHNIVKVTFPGCDLARRRVVAMEYSAEMLWNDEKLAEFLNNKEFQNV